MLQTIKKSFIGGLTFFLTILLLSVTYASTIGTVTSGDPLTETLWNTLVGQVNENSAPPVFSASLTTTQNPIIVSLLTDWTEHTDNTNSFSAGIFTVPKSGYYNIIYNGMYNFAGNINNYGQVRLYINDIYNCTAHSGRDSTTNYGPLSGINRIYYLNIGDTIKINGYVSDTNSFIYNGTLSNFTIEYIGE